MDKTPLAPVAPSAVAVQDGAALAPLLLALPVILPSGLAPITGPGALLGGLSIGGEAEGDGPIGLADRTPWLAMAAGPQQPATRVGEGMREGERRIAAAVSRRDRPGKRGERDGQECSVGVCICGRCNGAPRRP